MRILSQTGLWSLCVCTVLSISPLPSTISNAHAQEGAKKTSPKTKRVVKRAKKSKSVRGCMKFSQNLGADEESVDLKLQSKCKFEVVCSLEWELTCTGDDGSRLSSPAKRSTTLDFTEDWSISASAATCDADWEVGDVKWNCAAAAE